ncbi:serine/threonine-protein kinase, putative [Leishmania tarentolae]|uniref:non-specific serine/threonine protein kinase n=1 Tax=Leishmania tarentolae TaxID=5689 RepID=A0A640K833_LEITA|nr:serine/threonine-protein kinase, putative [Leishmania tarentolae]
MLRWATQFFGKSSNGGTGDTAVHLDHPCGPRRRADVPPLKQWWTSTGAEDAPASAAHTSPPASLTLADTGIDDDYRSPGILDVAASLSFGRATPPAEAAAEVAHGKLADVAAASATHTDGDDNDVDDFLRNIIAGKTDMLRKQLAREKIEAAAAAAAASAANAGSNPSCTRGSGAGLDKKTLRSSMSMVEAAASDGTASMEGATQLPKSISTAATTTGAALAAGGAPPPPQPQQQHHHARRSRYVSSAARSLQDYELIAFLGSGTFAEVTLARNKVTGEYFAVKKICKQRVKEEGCVERTFTERQLLAKLHHPFLVRLYQAFQSQTHLYLVLDFAQGGDLYSLNAQQLWLRSMRRHLIKMQYPYYQSTSCTFLPVLPPVAAASNSQQPQPKTSPVSAPADGEQLTARQLLPLTPCPAAASEPTEAIPDAPRHQPRGSSVTTTWNRDSVLASATTVGSVQPSSVNSAARSGHTVSNAATEAAWPPHSARNTPASSGVADGAAEAAAAVVVEEAKEEGAHTTERDSATDNHCSMAEAPPSVVPQRRQQQKSGDPQRCTADGPSIHQRRSTDLLYYTADAVDEFSTSCNVGSAGSRSSPMTPINAHTSAPTGSAVVTAAAGAGERAPAPTRDHDVVSPTASVASSGRERSRWLRRRRRRRTLTAVESDGSAHGGRSVSLSTSSCADEDGMSPPRRDTANLDGRGGYVGSVRRRSRKLQGMADTGSATPTRAASRHLPSPAISTSSRHSGARSASGVSMTTNSTASPLSIRPPHLTPQDSATPDTQVVLPQSPAHALYDESSSSSSHSNKGSGGADKVLRDGDSSSTPAEVEPQLASDTSYTPISTTGAAATPLPRGHKVKAVNNKDEGSGAPTSSMLPPSPQRTSSIHGSRSAPEKKAAASHDALEAVAGRFSLSTDITDAAKLLSATATKSSFVGGAAASGAATTATALRVDLAAPFHQVAMESSTSVLRTLPKTTFALDEAHQLPLRLIAFYAIEVALVLQYLHGEGFLYRDLKPENILICGDGHVMLTDFGVAKYRKGAAIAPSGNGDGVNGEDPRSPSAGAGAGAAADGRVNSFTGTTYYMSPEMLRGQPHDSRTDWWSYGCLLFEWANGRKAFTGQNQFALFRSIVEEDVKITAEDYRLTPLEVHTRVAQLHYRAEEVRLAYEQRVARRMRYNFAALPQSTRPPTTPSALTTEVIYNPDNRSFDVQLRSPVTSTPPFAQCGSDGAGAAVEGADVALANDAVKSCTPHRKDSGSRPPPLLLPSDAAAAYVTPHRHAHRRLHSYSYVSPHATATVPKASVAVLLNDSFANQLGVSGAASGEEDTQAPSPQSTLNDSFAGVESNSVVSLGGAPTNLSMRLATTEDGVLTALLSSVSPTTLHLQQNRHRRHEQRRLRLSCLNLDEATRDRYIDNAVAQMAEAQALLRDLTMKLLDRRMEHRLSGEAVLEHPFFTCPYVVSQLYYDVYQRRVLLTEMRRSVRTAFGSSHVPAGLVAPTLDGTLQQPTRVASPLPPLAPASPTPFATTTTTTTTATTTATTTTAAVAASHLHNSFLTVPLPSQTRPGDWRQLFMERRIRAPYAPRLRTRDDLRYFPAAVTATGLSAAAEQHRRIKEVKEQQKELMMMRANKAPVATTNNSFSSTTFAATLSCPSTQLPVNGSGTGSGSVVLVPLDAEAAQQVQQLLAASASSLNLHNRDATSPLPELHPEGAAALQADGARTALDVSHTAAAPVALTSSSSSAAVATAQRPSVVSPSATSSQGPTKKIQSLQLPSVEVIGAVTEEDVDGASPSHKKVANVPAQSSAAGGGRGRDMAEEAQLGTGESTRTRTAVVTATGKAEPEPAVETAPPPSSPPDTAATTTSVMLPSRLWGPELAKRYSPGKGSAKASPVRSPLSVGSAGGAAAAMVAEFRPDLFDRAATLPQSFVDAALAAAAQKQHRCADSGTAPKAFITFPAETHCSSTRTVATDESTYATASTNRTLRTGAESNIFAAMPPTLLEDWSQQQQLQQPRIDSAALSSSVLPESRKMAYASDNGTGRRLSRALPACDSTSAHSTADAKGMVEDADHDGVGGYYEQDALAEGDAHVVDGGDDSAIVEEAAATADMTSETDTTLVAAVNSMMDVSSFEDSHVSVRLPTPTRRGTLVKSCVAMSSSTGTSVWGSSAANPLSPGLDAAVGNHSVYRRDSLFATGPLSVAAVEVPPAANLSLNLLNHSRAPLGGSGTRSQHGSLRDAQVYASPLLSHNGEMHCDTSALMSSLSSTATMLFDDTQHSLSISLGPSGAGGPHGISSALATPSSVDAQAPEQEHQRRGHHHHSLLYTDCSGNKGVPSAPPRLLSLPLSLAQREQGQPQQPPDKCLSTATSFENVLMPATTSSSSITNATPSATIMMTQSAELTGVGGSPSAATIDDTSSDAAPSCTTSPVALKALGVTRDCSTTVGGVEVSPESWCGRELHSEEAARLGDSQMPVTFSVMHRGAHPSSAAAHAVSRVASMNVSHDVADDADSDVVGISDEAGCERSGGEEHLNSDDDDDDDSETMTTTDRSSKGRDEDDEASDASESGASERRSMPSAPTPAPATARNRKVATSEHHGGPVLSLLGSSASSISTTTSTSVHAFSMTSGASSTSSLGGNSKASTVHPTSLDPPRIPRTREDRGDDGDSSTTIRGRQQSSDTISLSPYDTPLSFDANNCQRIPHQYAHLGGDTAHDAVSRSMPFAATDLATAVNPITFANLTANVPLSIDSSSRFFSSPFASTLSLDTIGGGAGDTAEFLGPLTTTLSGVAYNVDDETAMNSFTSLPVAHGESSGAIVVPSSGYSGRSPSSKDPVGTPASRGAGSPSAAGRRRSLRAIWAQQQRKRIARELQQQQQYDSDPSMAASHSGEAGAERSPRGGSDSGGWWSYWAKDSNNNNNATIASTGKPVDPSTSRICAEPQHRQPHLGVAGHHYAGDDDNVDAGAPGRLRGSPPQPSCSLSGSERDRCDGGGGKGTHRSLPRPSRGNEGGADGRVAPADDGSNSAIGAGSGGFDHFQNFSFTSPQILQQYLSSSSSLGSDGSGSGSGDGDEWGRRPHHQRLRRGHLDGGGVGKDS